MIINKKLNLVIPIEREDGSTIYVHSAPISKEVYALHWRVMSQAFADLSRLAMTDMSGPRNAMICLEEHAKAGSVWDGEGGVEKSLLSEIRRLTNVVLPGPRGWEYMMFEDALATKLFTEDDVEEAMGAIVFFILVSAIAPKAILPVKLELMSRWWPTQVTSSDCTAFMRSLPTLTPGGATGATGKASSIPV